MAVDISRFQRSVLSDAIQKAEALQLQGRLTEAALAWMNAAQQAEHFASTASNDAERTRRLKTARDLRLKSEYLQKQQAEQKSSPQPDIDVLAESDEFREAARRVIHRSTVTFAEIIGLEKTCREIQAAFAFGMARRPNNVQIPRMNNLLFYGPPGCGKTLMAAAISNESGYTFFSVKVSDLMSRYYGDSPKLVQALYAEARQHKKSVIFLDEIDAIGSGRSEGSSAADQKLLVSLLTELDGLNDKKTDTEIRTIAATNRPWELDSAILSRFEKTVFIPLPDEDARRHLLDTHLQQKGYEVAIPEAELLEFTEGFSGREIAHLSKLMTEAMLNETNPEIVNLMKQGADAIQDYEICVSAIDRQHLNQVRNYIRPRTTKEMIEVFECWSESTGKDKSKHSRNEEK